MIVIFPVSDVVGQHHSVLRENLGNIVKQLRQVRIGVEELFLLRFQLLNKKNDGFAMNQSFVKA
ncbi:hypothetical protein [Rhizobium leguminosarum]|uniref:hypothetical protein n=1 Tax=Rhizobium leguminosarum TaxID=384 RepID=UPI0014415B1C|nr:hypothetical protein [Rhizobium leguminosarum]